MVLRLFSCVEGTVFCIISRSSVNVVLEFVYFVRHIWYTQFFELNVRVLYLSETEVGVRNVYIHFYLYLVQAYKTIISFLYSQNATHIKRKKDKKKKTSETSCSCNESKPVTNFRGSKFCRSPGTYLQQNAVLIQQDSSPNSRHPARVSCSTSGKKRQNHRFTHNNLGFKPSCGYKFQVSLYLRRLTTMRTCIRPTSLLCRLMFVFITY